MRIHDELRKPGVKRVILDTDTYNEIDDQFALSLAMVSDKIDLACVTAAPFHNSNSSSFGDGMEKSYNEIGKVTGLVNESHGAVIPPYFRGSAERMPDENTPVKSEAADKIAEFVNGYDGLTFIVAIGAITNVSSAILLHPEIREKAAVIWLAGCAKWFGPDEFNLCGDINAANALFRSGIPLMLFPCAGVVSHMTASIYELDHYLRGNSKLGDYLCDNVAACRPGNATYFSRVIWDVTTICGIINPDSFSSSVINRPYAYNHEWKWDECEGNAEHVDDINKDAMFSIMYEGLRIEK